MLASYVDLFAQYAKNISGIYEFCSNKINVWNLLCSINIITPECECPSCGLKTSVFHKSVENYFNFVRYCRKCSSHFSLYHGTILTRAHIDPPTFLALAYCWINCYSLENTAAECCVNKNTVTNYFSSFRDSVVTELTDGEQPVIGGKDLNVEIDETLISRRKYHRGRLLQSVWVFGGICRETKDVFALIVPDRTAPTLLNEISNYIAPGSIIHSDSWPSYNKIEEIEGKDYTHFCVNHSKNFVNPENGSHTQTVERLWRDLKVKKTCSCGISSKEAGGYVLEYIWRRNNIKRLPRGQKIIRLLRTLSDTVYF